VNFLLFGVPVVVGKYLGSLGSGAALPVAGAAAAEQKRIFLLEMGHWFAEGWRRMLGR